MSKQNGIIPVIWQKRILTGLCIVLLLVLVVLIIGTTYVHHLLNQINRVDPNQESTMSSSEAEDNLFQDDDLETIDPDTDETYVDIDDVTFPTGSGGQNGVEPDPDIDVITGDHLVNILLVGQDRREGEGRQRSDSMILVTFNKSTQTVTLTSFMRDQYVQIPGYKPNKLNAAYQLGGMKLLSSTLLTNFGVTVDGVVEVDFGGFQDLIDLLGGVKISLTKAEAEHLNVTRGWNLSAGKNTLNGEQALAYSRIRKIDSDYRRAERQRKVVTALIDAYKNQPITSILGMLDDILPLVTTNLTNNQIMNYAVDLFPMLSGAELNTMRIPVDGTFSQGYVKVREGLVNWFQYNIDFSANRRALNEIFEKEN